MSSRSSHTGRKIAIRAIGGLALVLVLLVGVLHVPAVQTSVIRAVLDRVQPAGDSDITLGRSSGSPFGRLTLTDVGLSTPGDSTTIHVDTLTVRLNPLDLAGSTIRLGGIDVRGVTFDIATRADGGLILPQTEPSADTTAGADFALDRFAIGRVTGTIGSSPAPLFALEELDLTGGDLALGESFSVRVDTLRSSFRTGDSPTGHLRLGADLRSDGHLRLAAELSTALSDVRVNGTARYAPDSGDDLPIVDVDVTARAAPFALEDLKPFVPGVNSDRLVEFDLEATGDASDLSFDLVARDDLEGRITSSGVIHATSDSVAVSATSTMDGIDAADYLITETTLPHVASAELSASLTGPTWSRLSGRIGLDARRILASGAAIDSLHLDAILQDGIAQYAVNLHSGMTSVEIDGRARPLGLPQFVEFDGSFTGITERAFQALDSEGDEDERSTRDGAEADPGAEEAAAAAGAGAQAGAEGVAAVAESGATPPDSAAFVLAGTVEGRLEFDETNVTGLVNAVIPDARLASCRSVGGQVRVELTPGRAALQAALSECRDAGSTRSVSGARVDSLAGSPGETRSSLSGLSIGATLDRTDPSRPWTALIRAGTMDIAPFLSMEDPIMVAGLINASGTLPPSAEPTYDATLDMSDIRTSGVVIDSLVAEISGTPSRMFVDAVIHDHSGRMTARGTLDLAERSSFALEEATFMHFDVTRAAGIPDQRIILNGSMSGAVEIGSEQPPDVDLTLSLDSTVVNRTTFESITGRVRTRGTTITADVEARSPASRFTVDGTADLRGDSLYTAEGRIGYDSLDVGALLTMDGFSTRISGSTQGSYDVNRSPRLQANLGVEKGSRINRFALEELTARLEGNLDRLGGDIRVRGASADLDVSFGYSGSHLYVDGRAANIPVHELLGDTTNTLVLSTDLVMNASADSSGWNTMTVDLDSLHGRWNSLVVETGIIRADVSPSEAVVDTFLITGDFGRIRVSGVTPLSARGPVSNLRLEIASDATLASIPVLSELDIGLASLEAQGTLRGPFERRRLNLTIEGAGLRYGTYAVTTLDGRLLAELDGENSIRSAELTTSTGVIDLGTMQIQSVESTAIFDGTNLDATVDATIDDRRSLSAGATWYREMSPQVVELNRLRAQLEEDRWQLAGPGRLTLGDPPRIDGLVWYSDSQRIVVTSSERSGFVQHFATIDSFNVGAVADLLGFEGLGGRLSGVFSTVRQDTSTILQGNANAFITAFGEDVGEMSGRVSLTESGIQLLASMTHETGKQITVSGTVPPRGASEQLRVRADADGFPIAWVRAFIDPELISDLDGLVEGRVDISGTAEEPDWSGSLTLTKGMVGIPELGSPGRGLRYTNIRASVDFESDSLTVSEFTASSGNGRVTGSGSARLSRFSFEEFDLEFEADDFLAINNQSYRAVADGSGRLSGSMERPVFSGDITVPSADFYLNDETTADAFEPVTLGEEDLRTLWERFGVRISAADTSSFDFYRAMKIEDLRVRIERDTWLRSTSNPEMDIQITGDLDVSKEHDSQDASVFGTIEVLPARSRIIQFGRRFDITTGTLTFNGPAASPRMELEAEYEVPSRRAATTATEVTIRLVVTGTPQDLEVEFQSDPQMELADIVSYIATGRPASESLQIGQNQSGTYLQSAAGIAMGQVRDLVQDLAGQNLGLDVIEITQNGTQGMTVTAGKYVTPEFYVAVSQPLSVGSGAERGGVASESTTQVAMEYEIVQQLLLSLMNRGTILRVTLRWEYAF